MEWFYFWLMKPIAELALIAAILIVAALVNVPRLARQKRCRHDGEIDETSACDAICRKCGKNLGFIGKFR
jgi:hypothetical protein